MVEDSECLRYPDLNGCGWDSGHSDVTQTSYVSHLRAEFARHEHKTVVPITLRALAAPVVSVVMMLVLVVPRAHRPCVVQSLAGAPLVRDDPGPHV